MLYLHQQTNKDNNLKNEKMDNTTHTLTFSLRDWKRGAQLLAKLGHNDDLLLTDTWGLNLDEWETNMLLDDLNATTFEWTLKNNETGELTHA
tara:strand:+ start:1084 stop:1359 length:276 start_codon:yes stop_codon:yes gene_type:complete